MSYLDEKGIKNRILELTEINKQAFEEAGPDNDISKIKCLVGNDESKMRAIKANTEEIAELKKSLADLDALKKSRQAADAACGCTGVDVRGEVGGGVSTGLKLATKDRSFKGMFGGSQDTKGFKSFNEFLNVLTSGRYDERLVNMKVATQGSPSGGGYAVPIQYGNWIMDSSLESEIVRPRASVWPMSSQYLKIPAWDSFNHTSSLFGGFAGSWLTENSTASKVTATLRLLTLTAYKLGIYTQASRELVADGIDFEAQLANALIKSIGWYLDFAFLNGSGVNQPLGILNDSSIITETRTDSSSIIYEDTVNMYSRLHPGCMGNSVWLCNQTAVPELMSMTIETGTNSGAFVPALQNSNGKFTLHTRPVIFTEKLPALGTKGDIMLVDLSQYAVGIRQEVIFDRSNAPGWSEDLIDYRGILRVDGRPIWSAAVTPDSGSTLSWCVVLSTK